jgi:hypothetical protein
MLPAEVNAPGPVLYRCCEPVREKRLRPDGIECVLASGRIVRVSRLLAESIRAGDEIEFNLPVSNTVTGTEIRVLKAQTASELGHVYLAQIGYVTEPKTDKHQHPYVYISIPEHALGILGIHLPCAALRDYFFSSDRGSWNLHKSFYDLLKVRPTVSLVDLRLAFNLRRLELQTAGASRKTLLQLSRAFNILAVTELRASYDALLTSPGSAVSFPFHGFGTLIVAGYLSRDQFFATRILGFAPERNHRQIRVPFRQMLFLSDRAVYRNSHAKVEVTIDPVLMPLGWDATWNQWKHLLAPAVEIEADFVRTGKYVRRAKEWRPQTWEVALPSSVQLNLPEGIREAIQVSQCTHHRLGQYSSVLERIRHQIQDLPMERGDLIKYCRENGIPIDFDVAQISWKAEYDPHFYRELSRRASKLYLFRNEFVFLIGAVIAIETPQRGHATYFFSRPQNIDLFLRRYASISKEAICKNQENIAEQLGYQGRIVHGADPAQWLRELCSRLI